MSEKFYLTTPIYYVNARPHIGHAYTTIVADVLARRHRLLGDDTFFLTGTDEHGQKIERSAAAAGVAPQQFADQVSKSFEDLWKRMGITNDAYIRTTDEKHRRGVQKLFAELYERGFIELRNYTGAYCVSDETFVDASAGTPCPDCGRLLETVTEENFFFRLSEFQRPLLDFIESNTLLITPESRRNEVLSFLRGDVEEAVKSVRFEKIFDSLKSCTDEEARELARDQGAVMRSARGEWFVPGALKDLSISRSSFTWGIPVPEPAASAAAQKHVIYVWLDALANYMTAVGYGSDDPVEQATFEKFWPADLHLVGKEIIRFHCVYWPAFLLAADLPLPKAITAHGWLLFDNSKMSKSKGNIVRTETILEGFGEHVYGKQFPESTKQERDLFASDVLRYFLLREIPFGQDGSFSFDAMITRYNADLANGYGNLVSRTFSMIDKFLNGEFPRGSVSEEIGTHVFFGNYNANYEFLSGELNFSRSLEHLNRLITRADQALSSAVPWKLAKQRDEESRQKLKNVLRDALEAIYVVTIQIYPFLPVTAKRVYSYFGLGNIENFGSVTKWPSRLAVPAGGIPPIFPRADKGLAQIMTDMENPAPQETNAEQTPTTDPAAPPRTTSLPEPSDLTVGGSTATSTHTEPTLSHTEATPSAPFDTAASQTPITAGAEKHGPADATPQITIDDFAKIELRVAQILVAERIPKADKLLRLEVDLGYEKRQILSGIAEWYAPEDLVGRRIVVITNLAPRKMRGLESHGMLLAASNGEGGKPVLATFGEEIALGSRLK